MGDVGMIEHLAETEGFPEKMRKDLPPGLKPMHFLLAFCRD
jgi:hypothetical protein